MRTPAPAHLLSLGLGLVALLLPRAAHADFTVDDTSDLADFDTSDGVCAAGSYTGPCTLRAAIMQANHDGGAHVITVPAGNYTLTITGTGLAEAGDLDIGTDLEIVGDGMGLTVIDGNGMTVFRQYLLGGHSLAVRDLTLTGAATALSVGRGDVEVERVAFESNSVGLSAPGYTSTQGTPYVIVAGSLFRSNGEAMFLADYSSAISDTVFEDNGPRGAFEAYRGFHHITDSVFRDNQTSGDGAAIYLRGAADLLAERLELVDNVADGSGGAIAGELVIQLLDSVVSGNVSLDPSGGGGGIFSEWSLQLYDVEISNNESAGLGGSIYAVGDVAASEVLLQGNTASDGGGIAMESPSAAAPQRLDAWRLELLGNLATSQGGGSYLVDIDTDISESVWAGNVAGSHGGGGVFEGGTHKISASSVVINQAESSGAGLRVIGDGDEDADLVLENTTFAGNFGATLDEGLYLAHARLYALHTTWTQPGLSGQPVLYTQPSATAAFQRSLIDGKCAGSTVSSLGYNVGSSATCNLVHANDLVSIATLVDPLDWSQGFTPVHPLPAASPAVDFVTSGSAMPLDQVWTLRPQDGDGDGTSWDDAGAYERKGTEQ